MRFLRKRYIPATPLALPRFDPANGGQSSYARGSITVTRPLADAIPAGKAVVVVHGVDDDKDGKYSGATKSDLAPALPTEATDPALCGVLRAMPSVGVATGAVGAATVPAHRGVTPLCGSRRFRAAG